MPAQQQDPTQQKVTMASGATHEGLMTAADKKKVEDVLTGANTDKAIYVSFWTTVEMTKAKVLLMKSSSIESIESSGG